MTILFFGGEMGAFVPSGGGTYENNGAGSSYNSDFSRCALFHNGLAGDPDVYYSQSAEWAEQTGDFLFGRHVGGSAGNRWRHPDRRSHGVPRNGIGDPAVAAHCGRLIAEYAVRVEFRLEQLFEVARLDISHPGRLYLRLKPLGNG